MSIDSITAAIVCQTAPAGTQEDGADVRIRPHSRHDRFVTPPVYLPMLAASGTGKLQGEWAAEPKLDGWRTIVSVDPSLPRGIKVRSRTGRFLTTQLPELHGLADVGFRM